MSWAKAIPSLSELSPAFPALRKDPMPSRQARVVSEANKRQNRWWAKEPIDLGLPFLFLFPCILVCVTLILLQDFQTLPRVVDCFLVSWSSTHKLKELRKAKKNSVTPVLNTALAFIIHERNGSRFVLRSRGHQKVTTSHRWLSLI